MCRKCCPGILVYVVLLLVVFVGCSDSPSSSGDDIIPVSETEEKVDISEEDRAIVPLPKTVNPSSSGDDIIPISETEEKVDISEEDRAIVSLPKTVNPFSSGDNTIPVSETEEKVGISEEDRAIVPLPKTVSTYSNLASEFELTSTQLPEDALWVMQALNACVVSLHNVQQTSDKIILEQEYTHIINNLRRGKGGVPFNPELALTYKELLDIITTLRVGSREMEVVQKLYEGKCRAALYQGLSQVRAYGGNPSSVLISLSV